MPFINEAIELPQEANPLNPQNLFDVLVRASSSNQQQIQTGAQQLKNWERQSGFYSSLQTIFIDTSLPFEVRYLAVIQVKNGIDRYWRKTAQNAISKPEKTLIRSRCLELGINEADYRLALQNAILTAKIVRFEFPHDWPDVITSITQHLQQTAQQNTGSLHLPRTLLLLLYLVKELSAAKLPRSRTAFQNAAPEILQVLAKVYIDKVNSWMTFMRSGGDIKGGAIDDIDLSLLMLRVLRRVIISGYEHPNRHQEIQEVWSVIRTQFGEMLSIVLYHGQSLASTIRERIEKHLIQMSKLHLQMAQVHAKSFSQLPGAIDVAKDYWGLLLEFGKTFGAQTAGTSVVIGTDGDAEDEVSCMEKLSLKGLLLLRACVKMVYNPTQTFKYQYPQDKEERKQSVESMKTNLLSETFIREVMEMLVTLFFVFRPRDLREWEEEPSEWERREEGEGDVWEFSIRSCAEKLFLDLLINNKDLLIQPLLHVFHAVATPENTNILLKDSIYGAIGLAAPVLEGHLDFNTFLDRTLVPELQIQQSGYNILRRRIAILLSQWNLVADLNRVLVYQIFQHLLDKEDSLNDLVVRVTAGRQMKKVADMWDIQIELFTPYAQIILSRIMTIIEEVELSETKMALLSTISTIVVRMEHHIAPFADPIVSLLPPLWQQAGDEYLMKQVILGILSSLITSMKGESRRFHNLVIPLIASSVQPESESRAYLLEEALDLWGAIVAQSTEPSNDLLNLTDYLFPMFETASESLKKGLEITEQYIVLSPEAMLQASNRFVTVFTTLLNANLKREANGIITHLVDVLLQVAHNIGAATAVQQATEILITTKFVPHLLAGLKSAYDAHQTTGPNQKYADIEEIIETDYFAVLARILVSSPPTFVSAIGTSGDSSEVTIKWLLTEWFSHMEDVGNLEKRKLFCLALTSLLELGPQEVVLGRLQELMSMWTEVVNDNVEYLEEGSEGRDCLVWSDPDRLKPRNGPEAPEDARRRELAFADPVHRFNIRDFIRDRLNHVIHACGGQEAFQRDWLVNVDAEVLTSFGALGIL